MVLLVAYTIWWGITMSHQFSPLSKYLALSSVCDVQRGESTDEVLGVDDPAVPRSQSNLNHKRYAMNDDTLYVAPADRKTDYSQPPMNSFYYGVLNTGRRRYGHPALTGKLPKPWLPSKARPPAFGDAAAARRGVVLSLRRKVAKRLRRYQQGESDGDRTAREGSTGTFGEADEWGRRSESPSQSGSQLASDAGLDGGRLGDSTYASSSGSTPSNPWARDSTPVPDFGGIPRRLSYDTGSGVIALGDEHVWDDDADDDDDESPLDQSESQDAPASPVGMPQVTANTTQSTYFHRPNRRRTLSSVGTVQAQ